MTDGTRSLRKPIPIIDLFAGPGGLGEGFSQVRTRGGARAFEVRLSIEKDPAAHRTLELRAIYRWFHKGRVPDVYWQYLAGQTTREKLLSDPRMADAVAHARREARCAELGVERESTIDEWIREAIGDRKDWVLLGGPPCQAYSLVGRARQTRLPRDEFEKDRRHLLYKEYLRIVRTFHPAVFVMENVKGLLSATYEGRSIFRRIHEDLSLIDSDSGYTYEIRSFVAESQCPKDPRDYVIRAEEFGIPQARHRVILLGVRSDLKSAAHRTLDDKRDTVAVESVLRGMPVIRSRVSRGLDSHEAWIRELGRIRADLAELPDDLRKALSPAIRQALKAARKIRNTGAQFIPRKPTAVPANNPLVKWLRKFEPAGWLNHEARGHMPADLRRYLFAAAYAKVTESSPKVMDFPPSLLPEHQNVSERNSNSDIPFADRFRVQRKGRPSTTVTSHIAKDGHYFIHYNPAQARSLTVREAARLQTFPDNYFFEGNRTQQFMQVGNAVPPYLAYALGQIVRELMKEAARPVAKRRSTSRRQPRLPQLSLEKARTPKP